jgi:phosphoribosylglycinamide formyltransferase 1
MGSVGKTAIGVGVLASGSGSNFQSLVEAVRDGRVPQADIRLLIVNRANAGAEERARRLGVESLVLDPQGFPDTESYFRRVADELENRDVAVVCLAGFLMKVHPIFLARFPGRVLNIHPALLPKYGGKGMYGRRVHEAVLKAGEVESGCCVHVVDEEYDHGPVLREARVPVMSGDTPETLAARVLAKEHLVYPEALREFVLKLRSGGQT